MYASAVRVLGAIRLSRETEATTSPARQRQIIEQWATANGHEIVGWAEDLGVSASVDPWERAELGPWLRGERGPFDIIACWRTDRLARRLLHFATLVDWCKKSGRTIHAVAEGFDLSTPLGEMMAQLIAMFAQAELDAIKARAKGSYDHLVSVGRHRGGFLPYGYRAVLNASGNGHVLEIDPDAAEIIRDLVARVISGASLNSLVADLNERGVPTSLDLQRVRAGREATGTLWRVGSLSRVLRSGTLLGYMAPDDGKPVVDDAGRRVRRAEPIIERDTWDALQRELADRATNRKPRPRANGSLLRRIAYCAVCGTPLYVVKGRSLKYYRCGSKAIGGVGCANGATPAEWLDEYVAERFLEHVGDYEVVRSVFVPGESHRNEIRDTEEALTRLVERLEKIPTGGAAESAVIARMREHEEHINALRALPEIAERWAEEPTGETYRAVWAREDAVGRRAMLLSAGVHVKVHRLAGQRRGTPAEVDFEIGSFSDPYEQRLREIELENAT